jgi:hypothetical protein
MAPSKEEHQMVHVCKPNFVPGKKPGGNYLSRRGITAVI